MHSLPILNAIFAYDGQNPPKGRKERKEERLEAGQEQEREPVSGSRAVPRTLCSFRRAARDWDGWDASFIAMVRGEYPVKTHRHDVMVEIS
jgi:hypothetical protein